MVYQDTLIGLKNIQRINQNKKGALCPFLFTTDYVVGLAVVFSASLSLLFLFVVVLVFVPYYSPNLLASGKSSTLSTGFWNAFAIYEMSRSSSFLVSP